MTEIDKTDFDWLAGGIAAISLWSI